MRLPSAFASASLTPHLVFQPIFPTRPKLDGHCARAEALLRLTTRAGDTIRTSDFFQGMTHAPDYQEVDLWVVNHALDWLARSRSWLTRARTMPNEAIRHRLGRLHVNVGGNTFGSAKFQQYLRQCLTRNPLANHLCLEITETRQIQDVPQASHYIRSLQAMGVEVAIDDFGSGYMVPGMLRDLPVDIVKLDGRLTQGIATNLRGQHILSALAELSHRLGARLVAEWVDNRAAFRTLRRLHVDFAQGYWCTPPLSDLQFQCFLQRTSGSVAPAARERTLLQPAVQLA